MQDNHSADADYDAIATALQPHQLLTLQQYAQSQGLQDHEWSSHRIGRAVAIALAVENIVGTCRQAGFSERRAIAEAAARLNLDIDTLARHRRAVRARRRG